MGDIASGAIGHAATRIGRAHEDRETLFFGDGGELLDGSTDGDVHRVVVPVPPQVLTKQGREVLRVEERASGRGVEDGG